MNWYLISVILCAAGLIAMVVKHKFSPIWCALLIFGGLTSIGYIIAPLYFLIGIIKKPKKHTVYQYNNDGTYTAYKAEVRKKSRPWYILFLQTIGSLVLVGFAAIGLVIIIIVIFLASHPVTISGGGNGKGAA